MKLSSKNSRIAAIPTNRFSGGHHCKDRLTSKFGLLMSKLDNRSSSQTFARCWCSCSFRHLKHDEQIGRLHDQSHYHCACYILQHHLLILMFNTRTCTPFTTPMVSWDLLAMCIVETGVRGLLFWAYGENSCGNSSVALFPSNLRRAPQLDTIPAAHSSNFHYSIPDAWPSRTSEHNIITLT